MKTVNPYQSPTSPTSDAAPHSRLRFLASLVPATLAIGLTLLLWVLFVSTLDGLMGHRFSMLLWAFTLFLSSSISIVVIHRLWRAKTQPFAFGVAFALFGIVFVLAEGDTSNGTDYRMMAIVYGTLLLLPVAMFFLARRTARHV
ncbi:hypothetical protein [Novipirellula artificiosorum]|uniref:Uncharacterized protein n=1 Tax=Novipirellula artificiosorum TaxID=2528016 RepID=A0A5C6E0F7_9BACT|nr:hypothetical protein [Novipirellula artificiosorum]TWU42340.1 hypothetical protein Poly41_06370 [Novipirellula artificiosorum]